MHMRLLPLLQCPICSSQMRVLSSDAVDATGDVLAGTLGCETGHHWSIEDGVAAFTRDDAPSDPWSRTMPDYARYCESQARWIPAATSDTLPILEQVTSTGASSLVDLCTGQGGLLFNLIGKMAEDTFTLSTDMSLTIQQHNRRYQLEHFPGRQVDFIACDAAALPLRDRSFAVAVSYGMANMVGRFPNGIRESARIVIKGGRFVFSHMYVEADSTGWRLVSDYLRNQAGIAAADADCLGLETAFVRMMGGSRFRSFEVRKIREVVGDPNRDTENGSIFPYPGETMTEILVLADA